MPEKNNAGELDTRKRLREEAVSDEEHVSKRPRLRDDAVSDEDNVSKRPYESTVMSESILDILDDTVGETDAAVQGGLESVIKSFEEEIVSAHQPDLWYLLEASDDELGLPPSSASSGELTAGEDGCAVFGSLGFDVDMEGYGGFEFGGGDFGSSEVNSSDGDCLTFDGLFDNGYVEAGAERVGIHDPLCL